MKMKRVLTWLLVAALSLELAGFPASAAEESEHTAAAETAEIVLPAGGEEENLLLPEEFLLPAEEERFSEADLTEDESAGEEGILFEAPADEEHAHEIPEAPAVLTDEASDEAESASDGEVELQALTITKTVYCHRWLDIAGTTSSPVYIYRGAGSGVSQSGDVFKRSVVVGSEYYVILSDNTMWYHLENVTNANTGETPTNYFVPVTSKVTVNTYYHTWKYNAYAYTESHPYHKRCECGTNESYSSYDCVICYPSYINYNANGGTGAPAKQTVTTYPTTLSTTKPVYFPRSFAGWAYNSATATTPGNYPGDSYEILGNRSITLYAVWYSPISKTPSTTGTNCAISFGGEYRYVSFTPTETDVYEFTSSTSGDTRAYLYDSAETLLASDDDSGTDRNFLIRHTLEAGQTYYYKVQWYSSSTTGTIPVYLRQEYDITFDANGGGNAPAVQNKMQGSSVTLNTAAPTHSTKVFVGWATTADAAEAEYQPGDTYSVEGDSTLYAVWANPSGTCGEEAYWEFIDNTLYITGSGNMADYSAEEPAPWKVYGSYIETIEISDEISRIGSYAFADCTAVATLDLPMNLMSMGSYAFYGCTGLTTLEIPYLTLKGTNTMTGETVVLGYQGMTVLEEYTFAGCSALTSLSLPLSLTDVGSHAFYGCSALQTLTVPQKVTTLGDYAFGECAALTAVNIPAGVTILPENLFRGCSSLQELVIPAGITEIGGYAFYGCSALTELVVPDSVTTLGNACFAYCSSLVTVTIPDSVETIGTSIFAGVKDQVTVRGYMDTPIHTYAVNNDIRFDAMMWGTLETPVFTSDGQTVAITASKGSIYYTTDGTDPTEASTLYTEPIAVAKSLVIRAVAIYPGWTSSAVAVYNTDAVKVATPAASYVSGSRLTAGTQVELTCATEGASILYTTNGYVPTAEDLYTGPIEITEDTTIYAMAVKEGMLNSTLAVFSYTLTTTEDIPVVATLEATEVTETTATLNAQIGEGSDVTFVEFLYYEKNNSQSPIRVAADGNYRAQIVGLSPDTEYYFQAMAMNDAGLNCGYLCSFRTEVAENVKPTVVELNPTYLMLRPGATRTLLATVLPLSADSRDVFWSSEDPSVATVDQSGFVTAVGLGNTRIKVTTVSGRLTAYCTLEVTGTDVAGAMDFSEINMATNVSNLDEHGHDVGFNDGGNAIFASAYLARWDGAVLEAADPYPATLDSVKKRELEADYHVQNILYLPNRQGDLDNDEIKNALMNYGAVYTFFQCDQARFFTKDLSAYYCPKNATLRGLGHAVTIVGWDDTYSKNNFVTPPEGDGAFICKNSWGSGVGGNGYFYISYYDKYMGRGTNDFNTVFCGLESSDNYNKIYQYDYLGPVGEWDLDSRTGYGANVFPESGTALEQDEALKAVSFYTQAPGTGYEIYVVTDYQKKSDLKSLGTPVKSGVLDYAGYFTVELDEAISLKAGTRFAVVVKFISNSQSDVRLFVETPAEAYSSNARANADESYYSVNRRVWDDLTDYLSNANLCIKAFTDTGDSALLQGIDNVGRAYTDNTVHSLESLAERGIISNPGFLQELEEASLLSDEESNGIVTPTISPELSSSPNYAEGAAFPARYDLRQEGCVTPVKNQSPLNTCWTFASYASLESSVLKKSASSRSVSSDGLSQSGGNASSITLNTSILALAEDGVAQIVATVYPYDSTDAVIWTSSDPAVATVSARGIVTGVSVGNATITAATADGSVKTQCNVAVQSAAAVQAIVLSGNQPELMVGEQTLMSYVVYPDVARGEELVWSVDDPAVASVSAYGVLTALDCGTVTVTAATADGSVKQSFTVSISDGFDIQVRKLSESLESDGETLSGSLSATVRNTAGTAVTARAMLAFYDGNGRMVEVVQKNVTLPAGSSEVTFADLEITGAPERIRLFLLDAEGLALSAAGKGSIG